MNGYPKNHDCHAKQPEHDRIARDIEEWEKTHKIEVITFGAVSNPQGPVFNGQRTTKNLPLDYDEED